MLIWSKATRGARVLERQLAHAKVHAHLVYSTLLLIRLVSIKNNRLAFQKIVKLRFGLGILKVLYTGKFSKNNFMFMISENCVFLAMVVVFSQWPKMHVLDCEFVFEVLLMGPP